MKSGMVLNIQRFSVHDGPGIRTLVFMKGCPLRCSWCSNPESQKGAVELGFVQSRCIGCGTCLEACPSGAITISDTGQAVTDKAACTRCGTCVEACSYEAREIAGKDTTVEQLLEEVEKDRDFYTNSGGGVTVGGGEPAQQHGYVSEFLRHCKKHWLHTALETCGFAPWEHLEEILHHVDFLYYDIKHMDPLAHERITGVSNQLILRNLERIASHYPETVVVVRVPVIPGLNDSEANITATAKFISELGTVKGIELLPYHRLGISKYEQFGMEYTLRDAVPHSAEHMKRLEGIIKTFGLAING